MCVVEASLLALSLARSVLEGPCVGGGACCSLGLHARLPFPPGPGLPWEGAQAT